jgi:predicted alpha-1,2-mannosidase
VRQLSIIVLTICTLLSCSEKYDGAQQNLTKWVNPFIGTAIPDAKTERLDGKGNVYPGAVVPWGMISPSPRNTIEVNPWGQLGSSVVAYDPKAKYMYGFDQMHLSGVGCHALGNIIIAASPVVSADLQEHKSRYETEVAKPGYYSVFLSDHKIKAEMTATTRTALMRFTSENSSDSLVITTDMFHNLFPAFDAEVKIVNKHTIEGFNTSGSFCGRDNRETVYFTIEFSQPADNYGIYLDSVVHRKKDFASGPKSGAFMVFEPGENKSIMLKIGVSYVSIENARLNLAEEQKGFDFDRIYQNADLQWNELLNRILVEDSSTKRKTVFYTAMYHTLLHPNVFSDVNGEYISMKTKEVMHIETGQEAQYTTFSLWDTYRNVHSFLSLTYPDRQIDMVRSMVNMAKTSGYLPKWELAANETYIMVGDPATPVIAETYLKGLTNFDIDLAYQYMIKAATDTLNNPVRPGITEYSNLGYIPFDTKEYVWGTMATSLEYNYADYAIAQLAKKPGKPKTHETFLSRSKGYNQDLNIL